MRKGKLPSNESLSAVMDLVQLIHEGCLLKEDKRKGNREGRRRYQTRNKWERSLGKISGDEWKGKHSKWVAA